MSDLFQDNENLVSILPAAQVDGFYTYAPPIGQKLSTGDIVRIRLSAKEVIGVVWGKSDEIPENVKEVLGVCDAPRLSAKHMNFIQRVARYTMTPVGSVLKMALCSNDALNKAPKRAGFCLSGVKAKTSNAGDRIVELLEKSGALSLSQITKNANVSAGAVKTLHKNGLIKSTPLPTDSPCMECDIKALTKSLSAEQESVANELSSHIENNKGHRTFVLDGVTGSGKTEVYFKAIEEALKQGKQSLILLPEIALTSAFKKRFEESFACQPAMWHSGLSANARAKTWRGVASGRTKIIAGARSSLFLPFDNLGLIVVDEEHDPSYKQEQGALYNARDMAVLRAAIEEIPIVLASATPSLETISNAWNGRYKHIVLPDRFGGAMMPNVSAIDMRINRTDSGDFISKPLRCAVQKSIDSGEQALLFLNRRGYAPLTLCKTCGHRLECPHCSAWMVSHLDEKALFCHHCGHSVREPETCPSCDCEANWTACGPGIERISQEANRIFPDARVMMLASDTASSQSALKEALGKIHDGKVDVIVGTQIIAKGHHFPRLTCVGVIDADLGLHGGELRAAERTYQLLHQVSGRAGREQHKGHVYLQSWDPKGEIISALVAGDRDGFLHAESAQRQAANMPPFSRLVGIILSSDDAHKVESSAKSLGACVPNIAGFCVFGPSPAPMPRIRGKFRWRLLARADKGIDIQTIIRKWVSSVKITARVQIDVDPQSFM